MNVLDLIRNEREYPWDWTPRQKLVKAANLRYRAYCLMRATEIGLSAVGILVQPSYLATSPKDTRKLVASYAQTIGNYLGMAVKG